MQRDRFLTRVANAALIFFSLLFWSCGSDSTIDTPDLSDRPLPDFELVRFEQALFELDTQRIAEQMEELETRFPSFTHVFFTHVIPLRRGDFSIDEQQAMLRAFLRYPLIQEIYRRSQDLYAEMPDGANVVDSRRSGSSSTGQAGPAYNGAEKWPALADALRRYAHYLPQAQLPDTVTTYVSQFEYAGFTYGEDDIALGLDFFLGPDYNYRSVSAEEVIFSDYLSRTYNADHLLASAIRLLLEQEVPEPRAARLIDYIVQRGKQLYLLDRILPYTPDTVLLRMTPQQLDWTRSNERQIYAHLASEELLYTTDQRTIRRHIDPAPTTRGMPDESPGEAANWLGWQIVEAYMRRHPDTDIRQLIEMEDGQQLLQRSGYRPPR